MYTHNKALEDQSFEDLLPYLIGEEKKYKMCMIFSSQMKFMAALGTPFGKNSVATSPLLPFFINMSKFQNKFLKR